MKYITLLAAFVLGFSNSIYSQIDLDQELKNGTSLEIKEGTVLVYGANYFGEESDCIFTVKSLNEEVVFDYVFVNAEAEQRNGTVKISKEALEIARGQNNYYHKGGMRDLEYETSMWMSDLVLRELIESGVATISTDAGASQVDLQNTRVGHDFSVVNGTTNSTISDLSYIYAETSNGKVKYWISLNEENPVILKMEMGWSIWLKKISTN